MSKLTPSQSILYTKIINQTNKFSRIQNYLLIGDSGNGKTFLLQEICKEVKGEYINFENKYGLDFFKKYDYRVIDENIFLKYISENIDNKFDNRFILLDELNAVLSSIYKQGRIINFISSYFLRVYRNKYLLSINKLYLNGVDLDNYKNKIFVLDYTPEDNKLISQNKCVSSIISESYKNAFYFKFAD